MLKETRQDRQGGLFQLVLLIGLKPKSRVYSERVGEEGSIDCSREKVRIKKRGGRLKRLKNAPAKKAESLGGKEEGRQKTTKECSISVSRGSARRKQGERQEEC